MRKKRNNLKKPVNEKNKKTTKSIEILLIIIIILILILSLYLLNSENKEIQKNNITSNLSVIIKESVKKTKNECLSQIGVNASVIYIYSENCIYSQKNTQWIKNLQSEEIMILEVDKDLEKIMKIINCLGNFELEGTPTYICLKNDDVQIGSFNSESELKSFISKCR